MKANPSDIKNLSTFIKSYIEAALWASTGDDGEALDSSLTIYDLSSEALAAIEGDCEGFLELLEQEGIESPGSDEQNGQDFFLTRNGHGAGFWDRGYGKVGTDLSTWAKTYGSQDLYVGDDGLIYVH